MNKRNEYIYQFTGQITQRKSQKNNKGKYQGTHFYRLTVELKEKPISQILVFVNQVSPAVWLAIEQASYLGKQYQFSCRNYMGSYYLVDYKELPAETTNHDGK